MLSLQFLAILVAASTFCNALPTPTAQFHDGEELDILWPDDLDSGDFPTETDSWLSESEMAGLEDEVDEHFPDDNGEHDYWYDEDPPVPKEVIIGTVIGAIVFVAVIVFLIIRHKKKSNSSPTAPSSTTSPPGRPQRRVDSEIVQVPAPAYQPAGASSDVTVPMEDVELGVSIQLPKYAGDLPPKYEKVDGRRSRGE